jgi:hypothetical protein
VFALVENEKLYFVSVEILLQAAAFLLVQIGFASHDFGEVVTDSVPSTAAVVASTFRFERVSDTHLDWLVVVGALHVVAFEEAAVVMNHHKRENFAVDVGIDCATGLAVVLSKFAHDLAVA